MRYFFRRKKKENINRFSVSMCIYSLRVFFQVALLLYITQCMIQILWRLKIDPDNWAIPLLTSLGDVSGMACLTLAFYIYNNIIA